jgi:hypothetical protein
LDHQAGNDLRDAGMPGVNAQAAPAADNDAPAAKQARTVAAN